MSGRWKGIILNLLIPGFGFMAQDRWGWGIFYLLIGIMVAAPTGGWGLILINPIAALHSGAWGDAKKNSLTDEDVRSRSQSSFRPFDRRTQRYPRVLA